MPTTVKSQSGTCLALTTAISRSRDLEEIYAAALDALEAGLGVDRSSILLFDPDGVMRFKAFRGLSDTYRRAVEGHTPWRPDSPHPQPIVVSDVSQDATLQPHWPVFQAENIAALAFIPLVSLDRVIGKFMLYYAAPTSPSAADLELAGVIAAQVAFAVALTRSNEQARRSEERLRYALDAAAMGTWDWDLTTNEVQWSDNLAELHGLPPGAFDGTFASYEREIHPEDRERVLASAQRAIRDGVPHDVEYRVVAPDGTVRWCEGKGRVEYRDGRAVRMNGLCMMVTRRKEAELERLAAAEEASRLTDEFLATLSHELRTPLNAILGWIQMLRNGELGETLTRQALDVIDRNARLQTQLIEDILDVSRIVAGKLEIDRTPVSVGPILETAVAGLLPAAEAKHLTLGLQVVPDLPPVEGDPKRLYQIVNNLLSNAIKFTPERGTVEVRCAVDDGDVLEIVVRDSGIGIAAEFLPYVFDRFRQADGLSTRNHGGLGLGLAITRHLVEQHRGVIQVQSDGQGRGTTVSVRLPTAVTTLAVPLRAWSEAVADVRLDRLAVLVVDDQRDSREMLATLLERRGAEVGQCDSAEAGLAAIAARAFDVVIADIAMPGIDGYEFIGRIRAAGHQLPAVAVTAFARNGDRQRALACGYAAYCAKPIDGGRLAGIVRDLAAPRPSDVGRHAGPAAPAVTRAAGADRPAAS